MPKEKKRLGLYFRVGHSWNEQNLKADQILSKKISSKIQHKQEPLGQIKLGVGQGESK